MAWRLNAHGPQCDEKKPECGKCLRRGIRCGFQELLDTGTISFDDTTQYAIIKSNDPNDLGSLSNQSSAPPSSASSPGETGGWRSRALMVELRLPVLPQLSLQDLNLFHHFTISTSTSMSDMAELQQLWKMAVPREAIPHDFLMHAILGVAAAHLAHIFPAGSHIYQKSASMHRDLALHSALPSLAKMTATNCHAVFAFAGITALSIFAFPCSSDARSVPSPVDDMLNLFPLIRGVGTVLRSGSALKWINDGELRPMLEPRGRWPVEGQPKIHILPENVQAKLDKLRVLNEQVLYSGAEQQCYTMAIKNLENAFGTFNGNVDGWTSVFVWGAVMPDDFLTALRARKPMALVILAHYGILIHRANGQWWFEGQGAQLVEAVYRDCPPNGNRPYNGL